MKTEIIFLVIVSVARGYPVQIQSESDLQAAETFWDMFGTGSRGYSGWGTGPTASIPLQQPAYGFGYGNYGQHGNPFGNYGSKYTHPYVGYASGIPTYENYALHGGHGFGKYGIK